MLNDLSQESADIGIIYGLHRRDIEMMRSLGSQCLGMLEDSLVAMKTGSNTGEEKIIWPEYLWGAKESFLSIFNKVAVLQMKIISLEKTLLSEGVAYGARVKRKAQVTEADWQLLTTIIKRREKANRPKARKKSAYMEQATLPLK